MRIFLHLSLSILLDGPQLWKSTVGLSLRGLSGDFCRLTHGCLERPTRSCCWVLWRSRIVAQNSWYNCLCVLSPLCSGDH